MGILDGRSDLVVDNDVVDATEQLDQRLQRQGCRVDPIDGVASDEVVQLPDAGLNRGIRGDGAVQ